MEVFLKWLAAYPYILLFFVVGAAVLLGKGTIKGYGLGMVASAIVVGAGVSAWASTYGIKMELNNFAKSLFYYLFMYGVGLRVGPSFINSLKGDGLKFTFLAVFCSVLGLLGAVALYQAVGSAGRCGGRHPRGRDDDVGSDRLSGRSRAPGSLSSSPTARPPTRSAE